MSIASIPASHFYTLAEIREILRISTPTVARHVRAGLIPTVKIGGRRLVPAAFVAELTAQAGGKA